jgi:hypothetical protein
MSLSACTIEVIGTAVRCVGAARGDNPQRGSRDRSEHPECDPQMEIAMGSVVTDSALGVLARSRALLIGGEIAQACAKTQSITSAAYGPAGAGASPLLHGEWPRR